MGNWFTASTNSTVRFKLSQFGAEVLSRRGPRRDAGETYQASLWVFAAQFGRHLHAGALSVADGLIEIRGWSRDV